MRSTRVQRTRLVGQIQKVSNQIICEQPNAPHPDLYNQDFAPTQLYQRSFHWYDFAALWVGLVVSITTWYLAGGLVEVGLSWQQGICVILFSNIITLIPMLLNSHPGTKYGIPFPVLVRSSFGVKGAHIPSLLRALVATGWFGIQTWVGGMAVHQIIFTHTQGHQLIALLGITAQQFLSFLAFWLLQVIILLKGMDSIRVVEQYSAVLLVFMTVGLVMWAHNTAGGFGPMLSAKSQFGVGMAKEGMFWQTVSLAVTANVGYWATLSLNIPDFSRYARSQKDQILGQALGLPPFMALFCFAGLAVTSSTIAIFGRPISDPIQVLSLLNNVWSRCAGLFGLLLATLSTNIAANVVAPANALVNLSPNRISFVVGGLLAAIMGAVVMPWKLISSSQGFIFTWLVGYSALLGPIAGIVIADYHIIRKRNLHINSLYCNDPTGQYWYQGGFNVAAVVAMIIGVLPCIPGFLDNIGLVHNVPKVFCTVYQFAWFVGFFVSIGVYCIMMQGVQQDGVQKADVLLCKQ